jgi:hypothetical protein
MSLRVSEASFRSSADLVLRRYTRRLHHLACERRAAQARFWWITESIGSPVQLPLPRPESLQPARDWPAV